MNCGGSNSLFKFDVGLKMVSTRVWSLLKLEPVKGNFLGFDSCLETGVTRGSELLREGKFDLPVKVGSFSNGGLGGPNGVDISPGHPLGRL